MTNLGFTSGTTQPPLPADKMAGYEVQKKHKFCDVSKRNVAIPLIIVAAIFLGIGIVLGRLGLPRPVLVVTEDSYISGILGKEDETITEKIFKEVDPEMIRLFLRNFSEHAHIAGSQSDYRQANEIKEIWESQGLDFVKIYSYNVLLSAPFKHPNKPSKITVQDEYDNITFTSQMEEKVILTEQNGSQILPPFNAYSAEGIAEGQLVYVNYATEQDFIWLMQKKVFNLTDKIAIARYGIITAAAKVQNSEKAKLKGLILYADPADTIPPNERILFPNSIWLPETGVRRESVFLGPPDGDPLTPDYPSTKTAYRHSSDSVNFTKIPVHPISYHDAEYLISNLGGDEVPVDWKGTLNITYRLGPGFNNTRWKLKMEINTRKENGTVHNVVGFINGKIEPDRYVILGNHRDAWVFGGIDPASGTSAIIELTRIFGKLLKSGWRPRRSLIFCSWAAKEFNLIGSTEWVEEFIKNLQGRTVAYLNMDYAVAGNYSLSASASPLLYHILTESAKKVPNPSLSEASEGRLTMYDTWLFNTPQVQTKNIIHVSAPKLRLLSDSSDHTIFITRAGIPVMNIWYAHDTHRGKILDYSMFHTAYDSFSLMELFIDPDFKYHVGMVQLWGEISRSLADALILPLNAKNYSTLLQTYVTTLTTHYGSFMTKNNVILDYLHEAVGNFSIVADDFHAKIEKINLSDPMAIRKINDQLMLLEKAFLDPIGLPGRPAYKHILWAPRRSESHGKVDTFPGLVDILYEMDNKSEDPVRWEEVKQHIAAVIYAINSAASTLKDLPFD